VSAHPLLFLEESRPAIVSAWADTLHESNSLYATRPRDELLATTGEAFDANIAAIKEQDFEPLNDFIASIAGLRASMGFSEHEVVDAFRAFRKLGSDRLLEGLMDDEVEIEPVSDVLDAVCQVVDYAILRFSEIYYTTKARQSA